MDFKPSAAEALHLKSISTLSDKRWLRYAPAYILTNENLHKSMEFMPAKRDKVLTVAASGDHPLFCKLYGAKHVTTFDITCNAKIITDIKIAAIQEGFDIQQYRNLLNNLHKSTNVLNVPGMDSIAGHLPINVQKYLADAADSKLRLNLFSSGQEIEEKTEKYTINAKEYEQLRNVIKEPFDFIWADAADLKLTESYDFIHLSNIADYMSWQNFGNILSHLIQHTNIGGRIFADQQNKSNASGLFVQVPQKLSNWELLQSGAINVLQRTR